MKITTLKTNTPEEGFALAVQLSQKGVVVTHRRRKYASACARSTRTTPTVSSWCRKLSPLTFRPWLRRTIIGWMAMDKDRLRPWRVMWAFRWPSGYLIERISGKMPLMRSEGGSDRNKWYLQLNRERHAKIIASSYI